MGNSKEMQQSLEMLFAARWNIPFAAKNASVTTGEMIELFNDYCKQNPPTYREKPARKAKPPRKKRKKR